MTTGRFFRFPARTALALAIALALSSSAPTASAGGQSGKVRITRRYKPADRRTATERLDATKYANYKRAALALLRKYPPETHFFLGVGRSPVGPVSFLKELNLRGEPKSGDVSSLAASVPASGLKQAVPEAKHAEYFRHFERFLPRDVLAGRRKVVLIDWVIGGSSVKNFATVLEAYWKHKGVRGEVILSGWYHYDSNDTNRYTNHDYTDFDFVGRAKDFGMNVSDGDGVAEFDGSHNIGANHRGTLEDLTPNPKHVTFRQKLRASMEEDEDLDQTLQSNEFRHLLHEPGERKRTREASGNRTARPPAAAAAP